MQTEPRCTCTVVFYVTAITTNFSEVSFMTRFRFY